MPLDDSRAFREACGKFATGVTVVTVQDGEGIRGTTANAFTSVSLDPPILLVSISRGSRTHQLLVKYRRYAVNVLSAEHGSWSDRFAGRHGDYQGNFEDVPHDMTMDGLPLLQEAAATFACTVAAIYPAGDHSLFLGKVDFADYLPDAEPLIFHSGAYHDLSCQRPRCRCSAWGETARLASAG